MQKNGFPTIRRFSSDFIETHCFLSLGENSKSFGRQIYFSISKAFGQEILILKFWYIRLLIF